MDGYGSVDQVCLVEGVEDIGRVSVNVVIPCLQTHIQRELLRHLHLQVLLLLDILVLLLVLRGEAGIVTSWSTRIMDMRPLGAELAPRRKLCTAERHISSSLT